MSGNPDNPYELIGFAAEQGQLVVLPLAPLISDRIKLVRRPGHVCAGECRHLSDCDLHSEPAEPAQKCSCGVAPGERATHREGVTRLSLPLSVAQNLRGPTYQRDVLLLVHIPRQVYEQMRSPSLIIRPSMGA